MSEDKQTMSYNTNTNCVVERLETEMVGIGVHNARIYAEKLYAEDLYTLSDVVEHTDGWIQHAFTCYFDNHFGMKEASAKKLWKATRLPGVPNFALARRIARDKERHLGEGDDSDDEKSGFETVVGPFDGKVCLKTADNQVFNLKTQEWMGTWDGEHGMINKNF